MRYSTSQVFPFDLNLSTREAFKLFWSLECFKMALSECKLLRRADKTIAMLVSLSHNEFGCRLAVSHVALTSTDVS